MITWGINALNHDISIAVFEGYQLKRFETVKGRDRDSDLIRRSIDGSGGRGPSVIAWYERPWLKKTRQLYAGQYAAAFDMNVLPSRWLKKSNLGYAKVRYFPHHKSHAAAGFYTSPFDSATIVVLDAMGEWESASIWQGRGKELKKLWSRSYPDSLGIFYSAFTQLIGYKPVAEEHLLQKDSQRGDPKKYYETVKDYFNGVVSLRYNLHCGVLDWPWPIVTQQDKYDIAAAVQRVFEEQADMVMLMARRLSDSKNLVYMGGCAMNSQYNQYLDKQWDRVWRLSNPGDPSSAIGAALLSLDTRIRIDERLLTNL